ncbi:MAG: site-specific integrase [bacterium]|nr:site-specific integrase [bacterium]
MGPSIKLRKRILKNGKSNFYLDIYYRKGVRKRETLEGLFLFTKPKTAFEKNHNKINQIKAQEIANNKNIDLINGFGYKVFKKISFLQFYIDLMQERNGSNFDNWTSCLKHLEKFIPQSTTLDQIDDQVVKGFKNYLLKNAKTKSHKNLSTNSCISYFNKFRATINEAFQRGLIKENPLRGVKSIKKEDTERIFLTTTELKQLNRTECTNAILKKAFLFSCYTGLRFSDIYQAKWENIQKKNGRTYLIFRQQKTKSQEYYPLNETAVTILKSANSENSGKIFRGLKYSGHNNHLLKHWVLLAGIQKHVTFHSARHTFATLMLEKTKNIFMVSKLLGHSEIKTTMVYAKIVDDQKEQAVDLLDDL